MATAIQSDVHDEAVSALQAALGSDAVSIDATERRHMSEDVYLSGEIPLAVVRPKTVEAVQAAVGVCAEHGLAIVPRGGGMSYTSGYLPIRTDSVTFDLGALDRILSISAEDMVVTVEAGCTWKTLDDTLRPLGLRTPYWGPVSGAHATVGGAMSQNSVFWGAVHHGTAAENVLGLDVVLADGSLLSTGARGGAEGAPALYRHYGPELTGLFTGDCGAFGLKVRVTLPLIDRPPAKDVASFGFPDINRLLAAVSEMARRELISEAAIFDQGQQQARVSHAGLSLRQKAGAFLAVLRHAGIPPALRMAASGTRFLDGHAGSAHLIIEGPTRDEVRRRLALIRTIVHREGGIGVAPTISQTLAARPFPPPDGMLAQRRFVPVHGIVPHSLAPKVYHDVLSLFARHHEAADAAGVDTGIFSVAVGNSMILIEPTWHWSGVFLSAHPRLFGKKADELSGFADNPPAEALVKAMRQEVTELFLSHGASCFQIGKHYPFERSRHPATWRMLTEFKRQVDAKSLMNPGALGMAA